MLPKITAIVKTAASSTSCGLQDVDEAAVFTMAVILGSIGFCAWLMGILNVGGLIAAYSHAYGGGWSDSGYVREAAQLGLISVPLLMFSRRKKGMRAIDWA